MRSSVVQPEAMVGAWSSQSLGGKGFCPLIIANRRELFFHSRGLAQTPALAPGASVSGLQDDFEKAMTVGATHGDSAYNSNGEALHD